jgi:hypothetical protein
MTLLKIISLALLCAPPAFAQVKPAPPAPRVSCIANDEVVMQSRKLDNGTYKLTSIEDWRVHCTITVGDKKIYDDDLHLLHPCEFHDAMLAIDEFRNKTAVQILKEKKPK